MHNYNNAAVYLCITSIWITQKLKFTKQYLISFRSMKFQKGDQKGVRNKEAGIGHHIPLLASEGIFWVLHMKTGIYDVNRLFNTFHVPTV